MYPLSAPFISESSTRANVTLKKMYRIPGMDSQFASYVKETSMDLACVEHAETREARKACIGLSSRGYRPVSNEPAVNWHIISWQFQRLCSPVFIPPSSRASQPATHSIDHLVAERILPSFCQFALPVYIAIVDKSANYLQANPIANVIRSTLMSKICGSCHERCEVRSNRHCVPDARHMSSLE